MGKEYSSGVTGDGPADSGPSTSEQPSMAPNTQRGSTPHTQRGSAPPSRAESTAPTPAEEDDAADPSGADQPDSVKVGPPATHGPARDVGTTKKPNDEPQDGTSFSGHSMPRMMSTNKRDHTMRPCMSIMRPIRLPQDIILRVVLYLIPPPALQWIRHDFHYSRHVRIQMLHEIFGAGCLPTHVDMSRYNCSTYVVFERNQWWRLPSSRLTRSRNHLHGKISRIRLALLNIVYWAPMSPLSRWNVIRTIVSCGTRRTLVTHPTTLSPTYILLYLQVHRI